MTRSLALVVCAAPLARRAPDVAAALVDDGWGVTVVVTPAGSEWLDAARVEQVTGSPPVREYRQPDEPKRGGSLDQVVVCPLTMNTGSKLALGIMDNYALGVLCEALAGGTRITAVTMVSDRLWDHPLWPSNVRALSDTGVSFLDPRSGQVGDPRPVRSGTGSEIVSGFDPGWVVAALRGQPARAS